MPNLSEQDQKEALDMLWAFFMECGGRKSDPTLKLWVDKCDAFFKRLKPNEIGPKATLAMKESRGKKVTVYFKTPDAVNAALFDATVGKVRGDELEEELTEEQQKIKEVLGKFIEYGESIYIEFDIEAGTATVVPL